MNNVCTSRNTLAMCVFVWIFAWSERGVHGEMPIYRAPYGEKERGRERGQIFTRNRFREISHFASQPASLPTLVWSGFSFAS